MLRQLVDYAACLERQGQLPPRMYSPTRIHWLIELSPTGELQGFMRTGESDRGRARGWEYLAPHVDRTSSVRAKLLADRAAYVLGLTGAVSTPRAVERVAKSHMAFVDLVRECARSTGESAVFAVSYFLKKLVPADLSPPPGLDCRDVVTFRVGGILPIDLPSVRSFWTDACEPTPDKRQLQRCLCCGRLRMPSRRHPLPIRGVPLGQISGMRIVSANETAFESYGLSESLVSPICHECAERYAQAANALLRSPTTCVTVGPLACLFWRAGGSCASVAALLRAPDLDEVQELINSGGRNPHEGAADPEPFYCAALAANGGRIAVRDWIETTVPDVGRSLARFFRLQRLVASDGADQPPWNVFTLAAATVREAADIDAQTVALLLRVALDSGHVPKALLGRVLLRVKASRKLTRPQAALVKMSLASWADDREEERLCEIDPERDDPAYLCGRLLAVLERTQVNAVAVKVTVANRFYSSASTAPLSTFPHLVLGGRSHLAKLHRSKPVLHDSIQRQLEEIIAPLQQFPAVLGLADQGLFALGYYHQRVANWQPAGRPGVAKDARFLRPIRLKER